MLVPFNSFLLPTFLVVSPIMIRGLDASLELDSMLGVFIKNPLALDCFESNPGGGFIEEEDIRMVRLEHGGRSQRDLSS